MNPPQRPSVRLHPVQTRHSAKNHDLAGREGWGGGGHAAATVVFSCRVGCWKCDAIVRAGLTDLRVADGALTLQDKS